MTKNEAVTLSRELVVNKYKKFYDEMMQTESPTIAQGIRDAAIGSLEVYELEWLICQAFEPWHDWVKDEIQCRTFMLLVAEALE